MKEEASTHSDHLENAEDKNGKQSGGQLPKNESLDQGMKQRNVDEEPVRDCNDRHKDNCAENF